MSGRARVAVAAMLRVVVCALLVVVAVCAVKWGMDLRHWTWESTAPIRFKGDISNAVNIGSRVNHAAIRMEGGVPGESPLASYPTVFKAYFDVYDREYNRAIKRGVYEDHQFTIDYPPARLLVATLWMRSVQDPSAPRTVYSDEIAKPMLRFNIAHELAAAAAALALVWRVLRDSGRSRLASASLGVFSATLLWLNPALILNAHAWPQWDAWVVPYVLWGVYFAVINRWMATGFVLAVGAMLKGQVLMIAPLFVLWPIFNGNVSGIVRLVSGFGLGFAVLMSPWLVGTMTEKGRWWLGAVIVLGAIALLWPTRWRLGLLWSVMGAALTALVAAPILRGGDWQPVAACIVVTLAILLAPRSIVGGRFASLGLLVTGAIFAGAYWFEGSFAWLYVGFQTDRYRTLFSGQVANVPSLLATMYRLNVDTPLPWLNGYDFAFLRELTLRPLLRLIAYLGVGLCAFAIARHHKRRDANLLIAIPAAWAILYAFMPQMHERYFVWAAACSALLVSRSLVGGLLAYALITAIQSATILSAMIESSGQVRHPDFELLFQIMRPLFPTAGWAVLTIAIGLLAWSMARSRPKVPAPERERRVVLGARALAARRIAKVWQADAAAERPRQKPRLVSHDDEPIPLASA